MVGVGDVLARRPDFREQSAALAARRGDLATEFLEAHRVEPERGVEARRVGTRVGGVRRRHARWRVSFFFTATSRRIKTAVVGFRHFGFRIRLSSQTFCCRAVFIALLVVVVERRARGLEPSAQALGVRARARRVRARARLGERGRGRTARQRAFFQQRRGGGALDARHEARDAREIRRVGSARGTTRGAPPSARRGTTTAPERRDAPTRVRDAEMFPRRAEVLLAARRERGRQARPERRVEGEARRARTGGLEPRARDAEASTRIRIGARGDRCRFGAREGRERGAPGRARRHRRHPRRRTQGGPRAEHRRPETRRAMRVWPGAGAGAPRRRRARRRRVVRENARRGQVKTRGRPRAVKAVFIREFEHAPRARNTAV